MSSSFVNLHTHSHYTLLGALPKIPEIVARAKELEMPALALTDQANLYGAIEFYKKCKDAGIKPILGVHIFVSPDDHTEERSRTEKPYDLVLLAKNKTGYRNLVKLVTRSHLDHAAEAPRIDHELLKKHAGGLICLSGSTNSIIIRALKRNDLERAKKYALLYQKIFGVENFYLEVTHHPKEDGHSKATKKLRTLSEEFHIPLVAAGDSSYLESTDRTAYNTLLSVGAGNDITFPLDDLSFLTPQTAEKYFSDFPHAIENTKHIADQCSVDFKFGSWVFPNFEIPENKTYDEILRDRAYEGLKNRGMDSNENAIKRLEYELQVIQNKGFSPYFLVVGDLLDHAHENGILTTIRGSVAGSLVTYLIGITKVDPLEYQLPFERFLNPERPSAPDIDMDFADNRRDEILAYAKQKYGDDHVAQIGTFGTMAARGAVRDIARALGYPYSVGDKIAKLIPFGAQGFPMTINRAMDEVPELKELYKNEDEAEEILDMAKKVEGCARHISVHAAGVVISPDPLTDFVPLQLDPKGGKIITQYDMHAVEDAGLTKFDFLGIRNLAILADAIRIVKKIHNIDVDIENIPLDDKKVFELLARGETIGLFQLGGSGMTKHLTELKPSTIHDINAMVALYRPGPMDFIPEYIRRKHHPKLIDYPHDDLKEDLERSFGLLVYQDDVMITAIKLAGYSWLEADKLRKAMGKKIPELMAEQEEKFKSGCQNNNIDQKTSHDIWERIKPFAAYGFNKAHAASYGRVAYQTAYMKANFPVPYMTAILSAESGDTDKIAEIVAECKRMGISILPPDVNESRGDFTIIQNIQNTSDTALNDGIRFGLYTIKNLGSAISSAIAQEREEHGAYKDFSDFLERVNHKDLNKKSLEALTMSGAMDALGERGQILANLDEALLYLKEKHTDAEKNQDSLFAEVGGGSFSNFTMKNAEPASNDEKLRWEKDLLGLYISGHPLDKHRERLEKKNVSITRVKKDGKVNTIMLVAGIMSEIKPIMTKKGDRMAFLKLADRDDSLELVAFPKTYKKYKDMLVPDTCVVIRGKFSRRNDEASMIIDKIKEL